MNNKNNSRKIKVLHLSSKINKNQNSNNNAKKKVIESYNTKKNNNIIYYNNKKINLETSITSDKNNNLSLFSFLSSNTNQEEKLTNKSLRTTRETESNHINNRRSKIKQKKVYNNNIKKNININKELDKFKNRIDNLFKIITNFENNFIKNDHPELIKKELDKIINKKYFHKSNKNNRSLELKTQCSKSIKNINNININITIDKENTHRHKKSSIFNSVGGVNTKNSKKIFKKNKITEKRIGVDVYNRRREYALLLNENSNKKIKTQRINNEKNININKANKNNKNSNKNIKTQRGHFSSKSIDLNENEIINKRKFLKEKKIIKSKNIYVNSYYNNKTPKIKKIEGKIK